MAELISAAESNDVSRVKKLIEEHVDVNYTDKWENSALIIAATHGYDEICRILVKAGTGLNLQGSDGSTALIMAAKKGHFYCCKLLAESNAWLDIQDNFGNSTALIWASVSGYEDIVEMLLDHGADPTIKNKQGKNAWEKARKDNVKQMLRAALDGWDEKQRIICERKENEKEKHRLEVELRHKKVEREKLERQYGKQEASKMLHEMDKLVKESDAPITQPYGEGSSMSTHTQPVTTQKQNENSMEAAINVKRKVKVKYTYEGNPYIMKIRLPITVDYLYERIRAKLGLDCKISLTAEDMDGDAFVLSDEEDLNDLMESVLNGERTNIVLDVRKDSRSAPVNVQTISRDGGESALKSDIDFLTDDFEIESGGHKSGGEHDIIMARRKVNKEPVALKIHTNIAQFQNELKILNHIAGIYAVRVVDARDYPAFGKSVIVEERCKETLADVLTHFPGGLPPEDAHALIVKACNCVAFLRNHGIVHGDLKPKNFGLIGNSVATMRLVILDCDGACIVYKDKLPSQVTLSYVAPERIGKENTIADPAVDLWSLGVMLYQMLTGKLLGMGVEEPELKSMLMDSSNTRDWPASIGLPLQVIKPDSARRLVERLLKRDPSERKLEGSYIEGHQDTVASAMVNDLKMIRKGISHMQS